MLEYEKELICINCPIEKTVKNNWQQMGYTNIKRITSK